MYLIVKKILKCETNRWRLTVIPISEVWNRIQSGENPIYYILHYYTVNLKWCLLIQQIQIKEYILENLTSKLSHQKLDKHKLIGKSWQEKGCIL